MDPVLFERRPNVPGKTALAEDQTSLCPDRGHRGGWTCQSRLGARDLPSARGRSAPGSQRNRQGLPRRRRQQAGCQLSGPVRRFRLRGGQCGRSETRGVVAERVGTGTRARRYRNIALVPAPGTSAIKAVRRLAPARIAGRCDAWRLAPQPPSLLELAPEGNGGFGAHCRVSNGSGILANRRNGCQ